MSRSVKCSASIVVYLNPSHLVEKAITSFTSARGLEKRLFVVDNSPSPELGRVLDAFPVIYKHTRKNIGYGRAHNWAINQSLDSRYHLILNPDVVFSGQVLETLVDYMDRNPEVGIVSPKILYENGQIQYLNRRLPTVFDLVLRRFLPKSLRFLFQSRLDRYEMKDVGYDNICDPAFISGAFMLCRMDALKEVGGFDPRFFLYFEDVDLSRKIQGHGFRTIFFPNVTVTHLWDRAPYNNLKMMLIMMSSGFKYFNKWGWKLY